MKKFLAVYLGSESSAAAAKWNALDEGARKEREAKGMRAWHAWMETHRAAIVEEGAPLDSTLQIDSKGVSQASNALCGYVVVKAESHEAAARLFVDHPHFSIFPGDSVQVIECMPIPGR